MAYNNQLGFDPNTDYTELYKKAPDAAARESVLKQREAKKAYMTSMGTYKPEYDASFNNVYSQNPVMGYDVSNPYAGTQNQQPNQSINPYAAAQRQSEQLLQQNTQAQIGQANALYNNEAKNAYISREQQTKNLPTQLAAQGITGGMAETSAVRVGTNYNNRVATSEAARQNSVANINIASSQQAIQMAMDYADRLIAQQNTDRSYNRSAYESDRNYGYQQNRDTISDNRYNTEWAYGVGRDALSDARYSDETAYGRQRDTIGDNQRQQQFGYNAQQDAISNAYNKNQDAVNTAYNRALTAAQTSGDYSGMGQHGWSQNQIQQANAASKPTTATQSAVYSLPKYAQDIIAQYQAKDGYDIEGALSSAVSAGYITQADANAALLLMGIQNSTTSNAPNNSSAYASSQKWVGNPNDLGYGPISEDQLRKLVNNGEVTFKYDTSSGKVIYMRTK